jgi:N-acetylmuramoyl-L-alanine amidase
MFIPIVFQHFSFSCVSIPTFIPLCIAPISWIGACFERVKSRALTLAKFKILKHNRYKFLFLCIPIAASCSHSTQVDQEMYAAASTSKQSQGKQLIVIDAGHGGDDIGAQVKNIKEKTLALQTATLVKRYLHEKGYRVILTRSRDVFLPLKKRTAIANDTKSKLFVSIHFNAYKSTQPHGIEIYYYNRGSKWRQVASKKLADTILHGMIEATGAKNRGVKYGNFHVIRETYMPAILIEGGFITNPKEHSNLSDKGYVEKMAKSIAVGIEQYLKKA